MTLTAGGRSANPVRTFRMHPIANTVALTNISSWRNSRRCACFRTGSGSGKCQLQLQPLGSFSGHDVPDSWMPVGWFWYA